MTREIRSDAAAAGSAAVLQTQTDIIHMVHAPDAVSLGWRDGIRRRVGADVLLRSGLPDAPTGAIGTVEIASAAIAPDGALIVDFRTDGDARRAVFAADAVRGIAESLGETL